MKPDNVRLPAQTAMGDPPTGPDPANGAAARSADSSTDQALSAEAALRYAHTPNLPGLLQQINASLWITTYQAGKLIVLRPRGQRLSLLPRTFDRAMGLAVSSQRLAVGTRSHIWFLENDLSLVPAIAPGEFHDGCFTPRRAHVTGDCRGHEIAWADDDEDTRQPTLWIVNTLFSCLCTLNDQYSFVPRWWPPFVDAIAAEDRCHLNGLAIRDGRPRYVTLLGTTNEPDGWRQRKLDGGCVLDVESNQVICESLCMPHSPRWFADRLWLLNSGRGELLCVDVATGESSVVARLDGYPRGLALRAGLAFVGLSQVRETATFGGVPVTERPRNLMCGVAVVELATGDVVAELEFQGAVAEIFDVQLLPGMIDPIVVGLEKDLVHRVISLPRSSAHGATAGAATAQPESGPARRSPEPGRLPMLPNGRAAGTGLNP